MNGKLLCDDRVLIRTPEGQVATFDDVMLDAPQRRLLRLVNGFTPLGHLISRLDPRSEWAVIASQLLERGLVVVVGPRACPE